MRREPKPGWFWELDRWNLAIAVVLLAILVLSLAAGFIQDQSMPLAVSSSLPASGQSTSSKDPGAFATPLSRSEAAAAIAAAGTSAARQGVVTAAPISATPTVSATRTAPTVPPATRAPVRLGDLTIQPPVFVPEAAWPVSRPGAPALGSLTGSAPPGAVVRVFDGNALIGQALAGADKGWRFPLPSTLGPGSHVLSASFTYTGTLPSTTGAASGPTTTPAPDTRPITVVFTVPLNVSTTGEATAP
jgi:hypothetical protein